MSTKRINAVLLCLCLIIGMGCGSNSNGNQISIRNVSDDLRGSPRTDDPFVVEFHEDICCIVLTCSVPCGVVTVTLESTAGDRFQTDFNTTDGSITIPVSGDSGIYELTVSTSDKVVFVGTLNL